jgi:hypothetical protein
VSSFQKLDYQRNGTMVCWRVFFINPFHQELQSMSQEPSLPPFRLFPDLNFRITLLSGQTYRGEMRQHKSTSEDGEFWYEGYAKAVEKEDITADAVLKQEFRRSGRPDYFHPKSNVEPGRVKLNRIPKQRREKKNAETYVGELWTPEGLWTVVASPSQKDGLLLVGRVVPSKVEMDYKDSLIAKYHAAANGNGEGDSAVAPAVVAEPAAREQPRVMAPAQGRGGKTARPAQRHG